MIIYNWLPRLFSAHKNIPIAIDLPIDQAENPTPDAESHGLTWDKRNAIGAHFYKWSFESNDKFGSDIHPLEKRILEALGQLVKSRQSGAELVGRMPGVVPDLMRSLKKGNYSGAQLSQKISQDVVLVQALLRCANSAAYKSDQVITSITHAIAFIGHEGLRQLIAGVAFRPIVNSRSGRYTRLVAPRIWNQSELCANANQALAPDYNVDPFEAFLAGLIQNIGLVVSLSIADKISAGAETRSSSSFHDALIRYARTLTCNISREWCFPETVIQAIGEQGENFAKQSLSPLGKALAEGDCLSKARLLVDGNQCKEEDVEILKGLPANSLACYQNLVGFEK